MIELGKQMVFPDNHHIIFQMEIEIQPFILVLKLRLFTASFFLNNISLRAYAIGEEKFSLFPLVGQMFMVFACRLYAQNSVSIV